MGVLEAAERWIAAFNAHDLEAIEAVLTPTATYEDPMMAGPLSGAALHDHFDADLKRFPESTFEVTFVAQTGPHTAVARMVTTTFPNATGRALNFPLAEFYTYDPAADRLTAVVGYFGRLPA